MISAVGSVIVLLHISSSIAYEDEVLKPGDGSWGTWTPYKNCPNGSLASAFRLRIQDYQGFGIFADDSGLNAIELRCTDEIDENKNTQILPHRGIEGDWTPYEETSCPVKTFVSGVSLKSDSKGTLEPFKDNRGATDLKAICTDSSELISTAALRGKHKGNWGEYKFCDHCSGICGIRVRMAEHGGDKTALNGAQFKCCRRINANEGTLANKSPKVKGKENNTATNCLDQNQQSKISTEVARIDHSPEPSETVTVILVIVALLLVILIIMGVYWMKKMIQRRDNFISAQMSDLVNSANNAKENIYCTLD